MKRHVLIVLAAFVTTRCALAQGTDSRLKADIAAAAPGTTLHVPAGTHHGPFVIEKTLRLIGEPGAILRGGGRGHIVEIRASDVEIAGFVVCGSGRNLSDDCAAIHITGSRAFIHDNRILDSLHGVYIRKANDCRIENNIILGDGAADRVIADPVVAGLKAAAAAGGDLCTVESVQDRRGNGIHVWNSSGHVVVGNSIRGTRDGIYFSFAEKTTVRGNVIARVRYGLHYRYSDDNFFEGNEFTDNAAGAALMSSERIVLRGNRFLANRSHRAYGLLLQTVEHTHIEENVIEGNTLGLYMENGSNNVVRGNRIAGNYVGRVSATARPGACSSGIRLRAIFIPSRRAAPTPRTSGRSADAAIPGKARSRSTSIATALRTCRIASPICSAGGGGRFPPSACFRRARANACFASSTAAWRCPALPASLIPNHKRVRRRRSRCHRHAAWCKCAPHRHSPNHDTHSRSSKGVWQAQRARRTGSRCRGRCDHVACRGKRRRQNDHITVIRAAAGRELLSHRLNRFLYAHLVLVGTAGGLPLFTPGDALARGAAWWLLHAVLYAVSLSALLLGLSSAHAESEEFAWLLGQPAGVGPWLAGKAAALITLLGVSSLLLTLPTALAGGISRELALATGGAAGVSVVCGLAGLAIGFWMRDPVRGLIASVAAWMVFLFGTDLLLLALAGAPLLQQNPDLWIAPLMANPLDAFRVTNPVLRRARGVQRAQCRPARRMVGRACPALAGDRLHDLGGRFDCDGVARSAAAA